MKKPHIPKLILVALLILVAASAGAGKVEHVTFSAGSGQAVGNGQNMKLTVGQFVSGIQGPDSGDYFAEVGIWYILRRTCIITPVGDGMPVARTRLLGNYPNPFNPSTRIRFSLAAESEVRIEVYDLRGRKVDTLLEGVKPAGTHAITYEPRNLASGAYIVLMRAGSFRATQRMMLVK